MRRLNSLIVVLLALFVLSVSANGGENGGGSGHNGGGTGENGDGNGGCNRRCRRPPNYHGHANCDPASVKENILCSAMPTSLPTADLGDLYTYWSLHYNVIGSRYYFARMAEALNHACPTNITFQKNMQLITPWSGIYGAIALDSSFGFDRNILRRCTFPSSTYPFLCTGSAGNPPTCGERLGTLSYISVLTDTDNHRWTLFVHCWNAARPSQPNAIPNAVSFNVFSIDQTLPAAARTQIIAKLDELGFDTSSNNLIEPDFATVVV